jgi:hypothetical protein
VGSELSRRERALMGALRNERQRWNELRRFAQDHGDPQLVAAMDQASRRYAERARTAYDVALEVMDEVLGDGAYAEHNRNNPDPGVQAASSTDA